ncbi:hypothetical protein A7318_19400 [Pseudomonas lurida]|nr:hypothetical protein A7318_19400 [Pseudomonas lurida]
MQPVLDRSLYPISKSVMLPADLLQRPSGHCTDYSRVGVQIQGMKNARALWIRATGANQGVGAGLPAIAVGQYRGAG